MLHRNRFQFKKLRVLLAWLGGAVLLFTANFNDQSFALGVPLLILGEIIRIHASGYLERKGAKLATSGPFAHVRNPLYVGNFFLGLGVVVTAWNPWVALVFFAGFFFVYAGTVKTEEETLLKLFGQPYADYLANVPRFIPKFTRYSKADTLPFNPQLIMKHREYITISAVMIMISAFYMIKEFHKTGLEITSGWIVAAIVIGLAVIVLIAEAIRKAKQKAAERAAAVAS